VQVLDGQAALARSLKMLQFEQLASGLLGSVIDPPTVKAGQRA
jgi:hypothetical protein